MKVLIHCNGTLEDIAALRKLNNHECHVVCPKRLPVAHITQHTYVPRQYFDVAVELADATLNVHCKCIRLERYPLRITIRERDKISQVKPRFLQHLVANQPQDMHMRILMEKHLYNTAIARTPADPEQQLRLLKPYFHPVDVYKHRFEHNIPIHHNPVQDDLNAVLAYLADGRYNGNTFQGSRAKWSKHIQNYHLPCLSLVAVAIALTAHTLPVYVHKSNI